MVRNRGSVTVNRVKVRLGLGLGFRARHIQVSVMLRVNCPVVRADSGSICRCIEYTAAWPGDKFEWHGSCNIHTVSCLLRDVTEGRFVLRITSDISSELNAM